MNSKDNSEQMELEETVKFQDEKMTEMMNEMRKLEAKFYPLFTSSFLQELLAPWQREENAKYLSLLSASCIISYLEPNKRLVTSFRYPRFRKIEKTAPLFISYIDIGFSKILIGEIEENFLSNQEENFTFKKKELLPIAKSVNLENTLKVIFDLFAGRTKFRVGILRTKFNLPMKLNMEVEYINVNSALRESAEWFSQCVRTVNTVVFSRIIQADDLNYHWIQNAKRLEIFYGDKRNLIEALPNLRVQTILTHFENPTDKTMLCIDLILKWCETRNGAVGSTMILTIDRSREVSTIRKIWNSGKLSEIGFVSISGKCLRLPMKNDSEARLQIQQNRGDYFTRTFIRSAHFNNYIHLQVFPHS